MTEPCRTCRGQKFIKHAFQEWDDDETPILNFIKVKCSDCNGTGHAAEASLASGNGTETK